MNYSDYEALESLLDFESDDGEDIDESDDTSEARPRRRPFRPKVPSGGGLYTPRPQGNYVTQVQLKAAMDRVGGQIKSIGETTKALSARVNSVSDHLHKETVARKKQDAQTNKQIQKSRESALLPLLLQKPPTVGFTDILATPVGETAAKPLKVVTSVTQPTDNLLPLILIMGMGGGDKGGDDSMSSLLPLILLAK